MARGTVLYKAGDYLTYSGWGITDMYVVHLMDPRQPRHWDNSPSFPYPPASTNPIDERLNTDFEYVPSNWFQAARGYYHFSNHRSRRYDAFYVNADGPKMVQAGSPGLPLGKDRGLGPLSPALTPHFTRIYSASTPHLLRIKPACYRGGVDAGERGPEAGRVAVRRAVLHDYPDIYSR